MYYEINVALNGHHLFATAERSITTLSELKKVYCLFKEKFPESEGYTLMVTQYSHKGCLIPNEVVEREVM